jgi:hypothetical protein
MKKQCDNCSKELSKFTFFSSDKSKIYRYNSAILCRTCFDGVRSRRRKKLEEEQQS